MTKKRIKASETKLCNYIDQLQYVLDILTTMYKIAIWAKIVLNGQIPKGLLIWKSFEFKKPFNYWIIKDGLHKIFLNQSHLVSIIKCHYMYISRLPVLRYCLETPLHPHGLSRLVTSTVFFFCFLNSVKDCLVKKGFFWLRNWRLLQISESDGFPNPNGLDSESGSFRKMFASKGHFRTNLAELY